MAETMKDIKALIEAEKRRIENPTSGSVPIVIGGEKVTVEVTKLHPASWTALTIEHPSRAHVKAEQRLGYNQETLPPAYPADRIKLDGEAVDQETWSDMCAVLDVAHRNSLNTLMWGINVYATVLELGELGKAPAGQPSSSPANRESRRAASKAGNRQK